MDYLLRANLRVTGGEFSKELKLDEDTTIGRLDTRYQGPDMDPLSAEADYDPQSDAITSGWLAAINTYLRKDLKYGAQETYFPTGGWAATSTGTCITGCRALAGASAATGAGRT